MRRRINHRRRATIAAAICALVCLAAVLAWPTGDDDTAVADDTPTLTTDINTDLDGDGTPDTEFTGTDPVTGETRTQTIEEIAEDRDFVRDVLAPGGDPALNPGADTNGTGYQATDTPNTRVSQTTLMPITRAWWDAAISTVPDLHMGLADFPKDARWVSTNIASAQNPIASGPSNNLNIYSSLTIAFDTEQGPYDYLNGLADNPELASWATNFTRGPLLTFVNTGITSDGEAYAALTSKDLDTALDMRPVVGTWHIDYGLNITHVANSARDESYKSAFTDFMDAIGYRDGVTWTGIATNPTGPWVGHIDGFDPTGARYQDAAQIIAATVRATCDSDGFCVDTDPGLGGILNQIGFANGTGSSSVLLGALEKVLPTQPSAAHRFAINWTTARGILASTGLVTKDVPYAFITGWVTEDGTQTAFLRPRPAFYPG